MTLFANERFEDIPLEKRPRERLVSHGVGYLSDLELIALLLGSGGNGKDVYHLAVDVLTVLEKEPDTPNMDTLLNIPGIGPARASLISAAMEFSRRRLKPTPQRVNQPIDVLPLISYWADRLQEHFLTLSMNGAHEVLHIRVVTQGILNRTIVHPREVFADPLTDRAAAIICAHNHPSGNVKPSSEDLELTDRLKASGEILGIPLLDHIIFARNKHFSFLEMKLL